MSCCKDKSVESETLEYLLGPKTDRISQRDMNIYKDARLCSVWADENQKTLEVQQGEHSYQLFKPLTNFPKVLFRQSYRQWKAGMDMAFRIREVRKKKRIFLQPLEDFPDFIHDFAYKNHLGFTEFLRTVCEIYFLSFEVKVLSKIDFEEAGWKIISRVQKKTQEKQYLVTDLQRSLEKSLPKTGYCIVGVSWTDLYPREGVNFCLGEANAGLSSAAICFGRFEPKLFKEGEPPPPTIDKIDGHLIWRMMKVITHETCHILGLGHCFFFDCAMNESNSLEEARSQSIFLCPVCLRKVQKLAQFDLKERYIKLLELFQSLAAEYHDPHFTTAIEWLEQALLRLE